MLYINLYSISFNSLYADLNKNTVLLHESDFEHFGNKKYYLKPVYRPNKNLLYFTNVGCMKVLQGRLFKHSTD